jgi:hypothetical protein
MVTKRDYDAMQVEAARSVMLELVHLLGECRDDIVVVGGWVPSLLIPQDKARHIGSLDVDLALNHKTLRDPGYMSIRNLLLGRGYRQDPDQPFIFRRTVVVSARPIEIEVDLLAGEYEGTAKRHRTQKSRISGHEKLAAASWRSGLLPRFRSRARCRTAPETRPRFGSPPSSLSSR